MASGRVEGRCFDRHTHEELIKFLEIVETKSRRRDRHLIGDHDGRHKHPKVKAWLAAHPRFYLYFTPTRASWLNLVERWFARHTEEAIRRGRFDSVRALAKAIHKDLATWNADPRPFHGTKSARPIRRKIARARAHANSTFVTEH